MLPLYVRAGTIIPYGLLAQHVEAQRLDPLTVEIYAPGESGAYMIHDQGQPDIVVSYRRTANSLTVEAPDAPGVVEVHVYGLGAPRVATLTAGRATFAL